MGKRRNRRRRKDRHARTNLAQHKRFKKTLKPPLMAIADQVPVESSSWLHERMPEMLWAALIFTKCKDAAFSYFQHLFKFIYDHPQKNQLSDLTLSGLAEITEPLRTEFLQYILCPGAPREALRELLRYRSLPIRKQWELYLGPPQDLELLLTAVQSVSWHQSENSTACRWVRVMGLIAAGKMTFTHETSDTFKLIVNYPDGDLRQARPSIRATEQALQNLDLESKRTWIDSFWRESWECTECIPPKDKYNMPPFEGVVTRPTVNEVRDHLIQHWRATHPSTAPEAKHDAVFGLTLYCMRILEDMLGIGISTSTLGRMGLRTILEARISLRYLSLKDDPQLWLKWREYGSGQAKLSALKYEDDIDPPDYIDLSNFQQIAYEDKGPEFVNINLAGWSGIDLRRMSERIGLKELYDQHYPPNSSFIHGTWSAVRETVLETCANPLHRLHRIPSRNSLSETVESAADLVDEILQEVESLYPPFPWRLVVSGKEG